ncbi:MAG: hypothetical protein ACTHZI_08205, partial [Luteimonas sp.]
HVHAAFSGAIRSAAARECPNVLLYSAVGIVAFPCRVKIDAPNRQATPDVPPASDPSVPESPRIQPAH